MTTTRRGRSRATIRSEEAKLTKDGQLALQLETKRDAGMPYVYQLEGDVEDVSRQHIANRASVDRPSRALVCRHSPAVVLPRAEGGAARPRSSPSAWTESSRRRAGRGHAHAGPVDERPPRRGQRLLHVGHGAQARSRRESGRSRLPAAPVPLDDPVCQRRLLHARSNAAAAPTDASRSPAHRSTCSAAGYTAWQRFDHNRIELVPERQTYKPGDTARIMIQSPWEQATALVTTEREGIRSHRQFALTSTQQSISIPITEADIPNVFVSVLLVKGRTVAAGKRDRRCRRSRRPTRRIPASRPSASATSS